MKKDRIEIVKIISDMLDDPDKCGIYSTTIAYDRLESYIEGVRAESIGWSHADACCDLDRGDDPRLKNIPHMYSRACADLA